MRAYGGGVGWGEGCWDSFPPSGGGGCAPGWSPDEWGTARVPRGPGTPPPTPPRRRKPDVHAHQILSDPLDDALAEHAVGANHQRDDHQDVRRKVFRAAADDRVDVAGRDTLDDADDQSADDR